MIILQVVGKWIGFHRWASAPEKYLYLSKLHMHEFVFLVNIVVVNDREIEFLELAEQCRQQLMSFLDANEGSSCETMAKFLYEYALDLDLTCTGARVSEDGMCGAIYMPDLKEGE